MASLDIIKEKIKTLYETNPEIHIDLLRTNPRLAFKSEKVKITGAYAHIFTIEELTDKYPKRRSVQYADILTKSIVISEIENSKA